MQGKRGEGEGEAYQRQDVQTVGDTLVLEGLAKLLDLLHLLGRQVARVAIGLGGSNDGEVEVVVLGVELHASGFLGGSHIERVSWTTRWAIGRDEAVEN